MQQPPASEKGFFKCCSTLNTGHPVRQALIGSRNFVLKSPVSYCLACLFVCLLAYIKYYEVSGDEQRWLKCQEHFLLLKRTAFSAQCSRWAICAQAPATPATGA